MLANVAPSSSPMPSSGPRRSASLQKQQKQQGGGKGPASTGLDEPDKQWYVLVQDCTIDIPDSESIRHHLRQMEQAAKLDSTAYAAGAHHFFASLLGEYNSIVAEAGPAAAADEWQGAPGVERPGKAFVLQALKGLLNQVVLPMYERCARCGALRLVRSRWVVPSAPFYEWAPFYCGSLSALYRSRGCFTKEDYDAEWFVAPSTNLKEDLLDYEWFWVHAHLPAYLAATGKLAVAPPGRSNVVAAATAAAMAMAAGAEAAEAVGGKRAGKQGRDSAATAAVAVAAVAKAAVVRPVNLWREADVILRYGDASEGEWLGLLCCLTVCATACGMCSCGLLVLAVVLWFGWVLQCCS